MNELKRSKQISNFLPTFKVMDSDEFISLKKLCLYNIWKMVGTYCISENFDAELELLNLVKEIPNCLQDEILRYWGYNADFALACYEDRIIGF